MSVSTRKKHNSCPTELLEEAVQHTDEIAQGQTSVRHDTFNLVEFCQMGCVQCLVTEHLVNGEPFDRLEFLLRNTYSVSGTLYNIRQNLIDGSPVVRVGIAYEN